MQLDEGRKYLRTFEERLATEVEEVVGLNATKLLEQETHIENAAFGGIYFEVDEKATVAVLYTYKKKIDDLKAKLQMADRECRNLLVALDIAKKQQLEDSATIVRLSKPVTMSINCDTPTTVGTIRTAMQEASTAFIF